MKENKKKKRIIILGILAIVIGAAAGFGYYNIKFQEKEYMCIYSQDGYKEVMTLTHSNNFILKNNIEKQFNLKTTNSNKSTFLEQMKIVDTAYQGIVGLKHSYSEVSDNIIQENITIDYTKISLNDLKKIGGFQLLENEKEDKSFIAMNLKDNIKILEDSYYTCKAK